MQEQTSSSIHDFDFSLICDYFSHLRRQGPGSSATTRRAVQLLGGVRGLHLADVGCGTGSSALLLAKSGAASVTCVDFFPQFLDKLSERSAEAGVADRVHPLCGDMSSLPFAPSSLDGIWCEGAVYNMGFRAALTSWRQFLKPGGFIALTEAVWLTSRRPAEAVDFWAEAYDGIDSVSAKMAEAEACGYVPVASFVLPSTCWTREFYRPARSVQRDFLAAHPGNATVRAFIENQRREAEIFERCGTSYGYCFFLLRCR
ncbi:MAG: class I SAM-dependent methyltransferase [Alloprevotella sp.]